MLFSLLSWGNPTNNNIGHDTKEIDEDGNSENQNPNRLKSSSSLAPMTKSVPKPGIHPLVLEQMKKSVNLPNGRLKHRDTAILIMRTLIKSDARLSEYCPTFYCNDYMSFLDRIENADFDTTSFASKHVLGVEGLEFSGKSTLIDGIAKRLHQIKIVKRHEIPDIIQRHSEIARIAWDYLENYRIAQEIMDTQEEIILVENYYHHFLAKYLQTSAKSEEDVNNFRYAAFSWPHDLPMPELVLFLTTTTEIRLSRREERQQGPETVIPGSSTSFDETYMRDAIVNAIFAAIRGPSTVGIDTTPTFSTVFSTVLEALDYFGFYCISRGIAHHHPTATSGDNNVPQMNNDYSHQTHPQTQNYSSNLVDDYSFAYLEETPILPAEVINNRRVSMGRVSMGLYGMYSKF